MILLSDVHLSVASEDVCFQILEEAQRLSKKVYGEPVACLGDLLHIRYAIPVQILNRLRDFLHEAATDKTPWYFLAGNHDQVDVNGRNALECLGDIPNVRVFTEPTFDPSTGYWLPYRKDPKVLLDFLAAHPTPHPVAHLHHGIEGAWMNSGVRAGPTDGIHPHQLARFQTVYCGHWHRHQRIDNCVYVGSQWQTRADEAGQVKGFLRTDGPRWEFLPIDVGPKYHVLEEGQAFPPLSARDVITVPYNTTKIALAQLQATGAQVRQAPAVPQDQGPRLGVPASAPLREQALRFVERALGEDPTLDGAALMRVFDEISSEVA